MGCAISGAASQSGPDRPHCHPITDMAHFRQATVPERYPDFFVSFELRSDKLFFKLKKTWVKNIALRLKISKKCTPKPLNVGGIASSAIVR